MSSESGGPSSRPALVFISHEKTDTGIAREIRVHLEADGFKCWLAPDDIRGPTPWPQQVEDAIDSCDVMVIVVSDSASDSPHVSREVDLAVEKAKPLLPVRIADVVPTGSLNYLLRLAQWIDLFPGSIADHAPTLQGMVGSMVSEEDLVVAPLAVEPPLAAAAPASVASGPRPVLEPGLPAPPPPPVPLDDGKRRRRPALLLFLLLLLVGVAAAVAIGLALGGDGETDAAPDGGTDVGTDGDAEDASDDDPLPPGGEGDDALIDPAVLELQGSRVAVIGRPLRLDVAGLEAVPDATASWSIEGMAAGGGQALEHTFNTTGRFDVVVELRAGTELETLTTEIDVFDALTVNIAGADDDSYAPGTLFRLQAQAKGGEGPWAYTWTLPDGSRSTGAFVSDLELPPGTHEVGVEVVPRDDALKEVDGLSATATIEIEVRASVAATTTSRRPPATTAPPSPPTTTAPPPSTTCPRIEPPSGYPVNCP